MPSFGSITVAILDDVTGGAVDAKLCDGTLAARDNAQSAIDKLPEKYAGSSWTRLPSLMGDLWNLVGTRVRLDDAAKLLCEDNYRPRK